MMDHSSTQTPDWNSDDALEGYSLIEAAAGSVTLRGLLYSLMQPAPRRFLSLKAPALFTTNKAAVLNKAELQRLCWASDRLVESVDGIGLSIRLHWGPDILSCLERLCSTCLLKSAVNIHPCNAMCNAARLQCY